MGDLTPEEPKGPLYAAMHKGKDGRKLQIREPLQQAIRLIEEEGVSIKDAALSVGYAEASLILALTKPHVKSFRAGVKRAWMQARTTKAWHNIAELADKAKSEDTRLKANKTFLEASGELGAAQQQDSGPRSLVQIVAQPGSVVHVPASGLIERPPIDAEYEVVGEEYAQDDID